MFNSIKRRVFLIYLIGFLAVFFNIYFFVDTYLKVYFPSKDVLFIKEKVLITLFKKNAQILGDGIVKPILPYLINIVILDIPILTGLIITFLIFTMVFFLSKKTLNLWRETLIISLILFNPIFLLTIFKNYIFALTILVFFMSIYSLYVFLYIKSKYHVYLFLGSFLLGFIFLVDYRAIFSTFGIIFIVVLSDILNLKKYNRKIELKRLWNISLILLTPTIFFIFFYMFVNFLITERFELDLYNRYLTLGFYPTEYFSNFPLALKKVVETMFKHWYLILPSLIIPFLSRKKIFGLIYIISGILFIAGIYYFSGNAPVYYFLIFSILPIVSVIDTKGRHLKLKLNLFVLSLLVSFIFTIKDVDFKPFLQKDKDLVDMFNGAKVLKKLKGKIILDNKTLYPLVVFYGDVKNIIFPYQFDFVYHYSNPKKSVDIIVINKKDKTDKFLRKFPTAKYGYLEGYYVLYQNETIIIFKNVNSFHSVLSK